MVAGAEKTMACLARTMETHGDRHLDTNHGVPRAPMEFQLCTQRESAHLALSLCLEQRDFHICHELVIFDSSFANRNVYALEKATKLAHAMKRDQANLIDSYTLAIARNALTRKDKRITNKEMNDTCDASANNSESMKATDIRLHRDASTATTQSSSSRVLLQALKIFIDDNHASFLNDNELSVKFIELIKKVDKKNIR